MQFSSVAERHGPRIEVAFRIDGLFFGSQIGSSNPVHHFHLSARVSAADVTAGGIIAR
jgi:hypothetical protein